MEPINHLQILRRAGKVLIAVGLFDIAVMVYSVSNGITYSSSLNVFAVVAGVLLMRGSLAAAGLVRLLSVFFLSALCALALVFPIMQPLDLTRTQARLNPLLGVATALLLVAVGCLFFWLQRQLSEPLVLSAIASAGKKVRSMWLPAAAGVALVGVLAIVVPLGLSGDSGARAIAVAQAQLGSGYKFHVSSLRVSKTNSGTSVAARVTAWNHSEVRMVPVEWRE